MHEATAYSQRDPSLDVGTNEQQSGATPSDVEVDSRIYRRWVNEINFRVGSLQDLAGDWDTYGGAPVSEEVASRAVWLLDRLGPSYETPEIYPLSSGGLLLEWESGDVEVTLEIRSPHHVSVFVESAGRVEKESVGLLPTKLIVECFDLLSERIPQRSS